MAIALVLGATGLVGRQLTQLLISDSYWMEIHLFVRRKSGFSHEKIKEHLIDFEKPDTWRSLVKGDVLFSALGTTLATAGSKEAQYKVDHTYQYLFAEAAAGNGVSRYVLVSAANSSLNSFFFYSRMKAELERDVEKLPFAHISILQPGMLDGERIEKRTGEGIALKVINVLYHMPGLNSLKPIQGKEVAQAMTRVARQQKEPVKRYGMRQLFKLAAT